MIADPKPAARVRDQALLRKLHIEWTGCILCDRRYRLELHHLSKHPRDDVRANLAMLCSQCHARITAEDEVMRKLLGEYVVAERQDFVAYLGLKLGVGQAHDWLERRLLVTT